jgi:hypothetical protein
MKVRHHMFGDLKSGNVIYLSFVVCVVLALEILLMLLLVSGDRLALDIGLI